MVFPVYFTVEVKACAFLCAQLLSRHIFFLFGEYITKKGDFWGFFSI